VQHFRYLLEVEGGLLKATRSLADHLAELAGVLARPAARDEQSVRFVNAFVRPRGLDTPATSVFVEAVEAMAACDAVPADAPGRLYRAAQPLVRRVAQSANEGWLRPLLRDAIEARIDAAKAGKAAVRKVARADRARRMAEKRQMLEHRRQQRRREHRAHVRQRQLAQLQGHLRTAARTVGSGAEWRKHVAWLKGRVKALMGLVP
jgi:hypothetical protein